MEDTTRQFFKEKYPDVYKSLSENGKDFSLTSMFRFANDYHQAKLKSVVLADVSGIFSADDMEDAYNDGAGINTPRDFNIDNYR
jgi:hypothetical protein